MSQRCVNNLTMEEIAEHNQAPATKYCYSTAQRSLKESLETTVVNGLE